MPVGLGAMRVRTWVINDRARADGGLGAVKRREKVYWIGTGRPCREARADSTKTAVEIAPMTIRTISVPS